MSANRLDNSGTSIPAPCGGCECLGNLPGIDLTIARRYANDKLPLLLKMLQIFQETHGRTFAPSFATAMNAGNWDDARRLAHTLKTGARLIGAVRLGEYAETLEIACKTINQAEAETIYSALVDELETINAGLLATRTAPPT